MISLKMFKTYSLCLVTCFLLLSTRDRTDFGERLSVLEPGNSSSKGLPFFFFQLKCLSIYIDFFSVSGFMKNPTTEVVLCHIVWPFHGSWINVPKCNSDKLLNMVPLYGTVL